MSRNINTYLRKGMPLLLLVAGVLLLSLKTSAQFYRGSYQEFGKNRLQFDDFNWNHYDFQQFNVYFYGTGNNLAVHAAKTAKETMQEYQKRLDYRLSSKYYILVFNNQSDWRQTNIGLRDGDEQNIGGITRIEGNKLFLYFEGDHEKFDQQIREGLAEIYIRHMMYGENWKDVLKNSALLSLPDWYVNGLVSYMAEPWSVEKDDQMRDGVVSHRFDKFNRLTGKEAEVAGHSLWYYIAEIYGPKVIPNILFMARVSRNVESGFLHVLGISLETLIDESLAFYETKYQYDEKKRGLPPEDPLKIRTRKSRTYQDFVVSPDGNKAAFVSNELGQYKVWIADFTHEKFDKKRKPKVERILKKEHKLDRVPDVSYPMLAWHPSGETLAVMLETKGEIELRTYDFNTKKWEKNQMRLIEKIIDFSYSPNGREMIISGIKNGQTDLFVYKVLTKSIHQLTYDVYDDLNPQFIDGGERVIFSSNRFNDTLRNTARDNTDDFMENHDLFIYDYEDKEQILTRLTNTEDVNERNPYQLGEDKYTYISDENGVYNRYLAYRDSSISRIDTTIHYRFFTRTKPASNYKRNIMYQDISTAADKMVEMLYWDGRYRFYIQPASSIQEVNELDVITTQETKSNKVSGFVQDSIKVQLVETQQIQPKEQEEESDNTVDIDHYTFGNEEGKKAEKEKKFKTPEKESNYVKIEGEESSGNQNEGTGNKKEDEFTLPVRSVYRTAYQPTDIVTQLDFNFANNIYQRFNGGPYVNPGMGAVVKVGALDLMEDYKIEGGMRYSFDNNNTEYFLSFHNRKRRLDKKYIFQRQTVTQQTDPSTLERTYIHKLQGVFRWPFSEVLALQTTLSGRNDRNVVLATDNETLDEDGYTENWLGSKLELIFDNTRDLGLNLYSGTRYKIFAEAYYVPEKGATDMYIVGMDFRNYQRIHRELIFATRLAGSTSFGSRKLVYYMGSVDNWIVLGDQERFDNETTISQDQNYYFQALATNMRGFIQNVRNGNSFVVLNAELRWPIFKYFMSKPIKSDFIKNFQLIGFGDLGTAWTGATPYSDENEFNSTTIDRTAFKVILKNEKDPIVGAYGFGARMKLLGYFVRIDYAWGVEDGIVQKPITHLSLGLDF